MPDLSRTDLETTEIIYGEESTTKMTLQFAYNTETRIDCCLDSVAVSVAVGVEQFKQAIIDAAERGICLRYITEITKENIAYCKELAKLAELRHADGIKGNVAVNEKESLSTAIVMREAKPVPKAIYSNIQEVIQQQQSFFETLWHKAIPAEQRIKEIEEGILPIETRILNHTGEIRKRIIKMHETSNELSICSITNGMRLIYSEFFQDFFQIMEGQEQARRTGIRWVTTVEKEDLDIVKILNDAGIQIRHVQNLIPVNFAVSDKMLNATIEEMEGGNMVQNLLTSTEPLYVGHFKLIFEQLWKNGVDANNRITQIEQGVVQAHFEIINNPNEALDKAWSLVASAKEEILLLFSTANAFRRQVQMGGLHVIMKAVENGAKVRILLPEDDKVEETINQLKLLAPQIEFRSTDRSLETRITFLAVDRKECMLFELKDDATDSSFDAVGITAYTSSKSIVFSYATIIQNLWKQAELYEVIRTQERAQKEFINIAAHELRTPIQPILGMADLLESQFYGKAGKKKGEITREELTILIRNAKRLERLSSDILEIARIEAGKLNLNVRMFDLNDAILPLVEDAKKHSGTHKEVKIQYRPTHVMLRADKDRIIEIIWNLLDNAIKFTEQGTISIEVKRDDGRVIVTVKDNGKGIDAEIFPKLFAKFITKSEKGTGLGLYISKNIVEAHGGEIWAKNNENGEGAIFGISLPLS